MKLSHFSIMVSSTQHARNLLCNCFGFTVKSNDEGIRRAMVEDASGNCFEINQCRAGDKPQGHIGFAFETRDKFWEKYSEIEPFLEEESKLTRELLTRKSNGQGCVSFIAKCGLTIELTWGKDFLQAHETRPSVRKLVKPNETLAAAA